MAVSFQGFRALIENSPHVISLINARGEILQGNASRTSSFGYKADELVGRNYLDLIHPDDRDHALRALKQVVSEPPGPCQWDARIRHKDGHYSWVESTVLNLLFELEVHAMVLHQRDIEDRKAAEVKSQQTSAELARSNARLEEFASIAAHDLREPLGTISRFTEMLFERTAMDPNMEQMANFVLEGTARMTTLIDDLLSFAQMGTYLPPQPVDLRRAVDQAAQNLILEIEESGAVLTVGELPVVQGNEIHLVRLFQNLLGNAIKYRDERALRIQVTAEQVGPDWLIRVKDNGIGVAPENLARIFAPFVRLGHRHVRGSGLGLAACKKIVEEAAGRIWMESELGTGSTVCFTILRTEPNPPIQRSNGRNGTKVQEGSR
jgi:PAS domain S-box-containing protein